MNRTSSASLTPLTLPRARSPLATVGSRSPRAFLLVCLLTTPLVGDVYGQEQPEAPDTTAIHAAADTTAVHAAADTTAVHAAADTTKRQGVRALLPDPENVAELSAKVLTEDEDITEEHFWRREPLGFGLSTARDLWQGIRVLGSPESKLRSYIATNIQPLGLFAALAIVAIALAVIVKRLVAVRLALRVGQLLRPMRNRTPSFVNRVIVSITRLISRVLAPALVLCTYHLVLRLAHMTDPWFRALGDLLAGWTIFVVVLRLMHEILLGGLISVHKENGRRLYHDLRVASIIGFLGLVTVSLADRAGAPGDVIALATVGVQFVFLVAFGAALRHRSVVLDVFPNFENRAYRTFLRWLGRFYGPVIFFTIAVLLAGLLGYSNLAEFLLVRSWFLVAIFVVTIGLHTGLLNILRRVLIERHEASHEAWSLYRSVVLLITYVMAISVGTLFLRIVGLLTPITRALSSELGSVGDQTLSVLVLVKAIAVILIFVFVGRLISNYLDFQVYPQWNVDSGVGNAVNTMVTGILIVVGTIISLTTVGLDLRVIGYFAGAVGLGIGFGLQNYANNLVSGLTIIFGRNLKRGDFVSVGEQEGFVQQVGIRATRIRTRDSIEYSIPNAKFLQDKIVNWSHSSPLVRVHVPIGVSYNADPDRVREILIAVARANDSVEKRPSPDIWFTAFGASSLDFDLLVWVNVRHMAIETVRSQLYFAAFDALKEAGIEIPFPQRDLHIRSGLHRLEEAP